ncbi:hypothetical protein [Novosphingobium sp.]|uniref:hypothetical protein n=1 Tax=Novosphingobium sp. TaxID=1874826 RepID=UPI002733C2A4|nr:hypothetical protein [Novosphingobium sp.]MDP3905663.1 hypothetical protein [Novosphingobium sp.]
MNKSGRLLGQAGAIALVALGASPALASGTLAGSSITNTVTVNYQVGGIAQTSTDAGDTFTVDRKVAFVVAESGDTTTTTVSPGQEAAVTTFQITNQSNATLDFALAAAQVADGGSGAHTGTDSFDTTNVRIHVDTNGNGVYDAGTDLLVTYLDELAPDASMTVFVLADIPLSLTNGAFSAVTLTATAHGSATAVSGTVGTLDSILSETTGANTSGMDTVFADAAGATDAEGDGMHSAKDDYTVYTASLTITKNSRLISDPVNLTTNPKAIPGATIEYCIVVANASGSQTATDVAISDPLPSTVSYASGYGIFLNGTVTGGDCDENGSSGGSFGSDTVSGTLASVAAGETKTLRFRATIN